MTCKDCISYNENYKLYPPYAKCDKTSGEIFNYVVTADDEICPDFEPKENSWDEVSK